MSCSRTTRARAASRSGVRKICVAPSRASRTRGEHLQDGGVERFEAHAQVGAVRDGWGRNRHHDGAQPAIATSGIGCDYGRGVAGIPPHLVRRGRMPWMKSVGPVHFREEDNLGTSLGICAWSPGVQVEFTSRSTWPVMGPAPDPSSDPRNPGSPELPDAWPRAPAGPSW